MNLAHLLMNFILLSGHVFRIDEMYYTVYFIVS